MFRNREWIAPAVACVAFLAAFLAFLFVLVRYFGSVREWSKADLDSRARLAASALGEPLRTLDFKTIEATAGRLRDEGLRLRIVTGGSFRAPEGADRSAGFYDSVGNAGPGECRFQWGAAPCGGFTVGVGRPSSETLRPFFNSLLVAALAALAGVFAMGFVFFALYRQRVRISELAALERFRRDFIADVSHEIRTPLTGILGAVDMLGDGADAKTGPLLGLLRGSVGRLSSLVQQILDLSKMESEGAGGHGLDLSETDLSELARSVASAAGVGFHGGGSAASSCTAFCDARLVAQALENLVENARRHSGSDEIFVECSSSGSDVVLAVEDRGVGIPEEHVARIFERFYRVDPARAAETGGAGLGLAIVRRIARLHGGEATYRPARPKGGRFEITLPVKARGLRRAPYRA